MFTLFTYKVDYLIFFLEFCTALNRTILELKHTITLITYAPQPTLNRTILELVKTEFKSC